MRHRAIHDHEEVTIRRDLFPLLLVLGLAAILRCAHLGVLPLTGAEAYAWQQAQHPDLAYVEGPGGNAFLVHTALGLGSGLPSEGAIRFGHAIVGVMAVLAAYLAGKAFFSGVAGLLAASLLAAATPFVLPARHVSEAAPQLALLLLSLWLLAPLWRVREPPAPGRVLAAGLAMALLFQVGYVAWLALPTVLLALALARPERLRQGPVWVFVALALVGIAPWAMWNWAHQGIGLDHLAALWHSRPSLAMRTAALVDWAGALALLAAALSLVGLPQRGNRALLVPGLLSLLAGLAWPGDPTGPWACGLGLLFLSLGDSLHRWAAQRLPRSQEWFPLRSLVPTLLLALLALASYDAIVQTMAPESGVLYRAASEAIYQETAPWFTFPRVRTAPWRHHLPSFAPGLWLVLEDGLAAQMAYYMDVPVYGLGAQQRLWGIPPFTEALVVTGLHVDRNELTWHLRQDFDAVEGPTGQGLLEGQLSPYVLVWRVSGPQADADALIEHYAALRQELLYD